jgi:hypothetical protein
MTVNRPDRTILESALGAAVLTERPHLFSNLQVVLPRKPYEQILDLVRGVTQLVSLPSYQAAVASRQGAGILPMPPGVCLAFDFHVGGEAPQLIEINTNAGGSLLVTLLERAWGNTAAADMADAALLQMFQNEWSAWGAGRPLQTIAIVDEAPEQQYLYPEFIRWQTLFESLGIQAQICAPEQLRCDDAGRLWCGEQGEAIDLLYNRLTDFSLTSAPCTAIHAAWLRQLAGKTTGSLITPNPQAHGLWADKRNLQWLSDPDALKSFGLSLAETESVCRCVPPTLPVLADEAEQFWATRKQWFFKPQAGFGSRAAYRGDKLTKRVFEEIIQGGYVAQRFAPAPELEATDSVTGDPVRLKYDLRVYAYGGEIQLLAARLYQGQTTNFRTPGGGFAPVIVRG